MNRSSSLVVRATMHCIISNITTKESLIRTFTYMEVVYASSASVWRRETLLNWFLLLSCSLISSWEEGPSWIEPSIEVSNDTLWMYFFTPKKKNRKHSIDSFNSLIYVISSIFIWFLNFNSLHKCLNFNYLFFSAGLMEVTRKIDGTTTIVIDECLVLSCNL